MSVALSVLCTIFHACIQNNRTFSLIRALVQISSSRHNFRGWWRRECRCTERKGHQNRLRDAARLNDKACFVFDVFFFFFFLWMNTCSCALAAWSCLYLFDGEIPTFSMSRSHHSPRWADNVKEVSSTMCFYLVFSARCLNTVCDKENIQTRMPDG